ncbi:MAG: hypothetical protein ACREQX_20055 [Candidatus Binataceae bacterium]
MNWDSYHSASEKLAVEAECARRGGDYRRAEEFYKKASAEEVRAFGQLAADKRRTRGITAVSAVALSYKGREYDMAEHLACQYLAEIPFPAFAQSQLRELLQLIWTARAAGSAGVRFAPGDVLVSVKGGEIIHGGAPLELIIHKIETIKAVLSRTVEMLLDRPFRRRGAPESDVHSMFTPWLFQAPAGSYQFAVRVEEQKQRELWESSNKPKIENVTTIFFNVLRASANDPEGALPAIVPRSEYREAFLNLSRNLAPTGKAFERLEVRDASSPSDPIASFVTATRQLLNEAIRKSKPSGATDERTVRMRGILRALHLDQDWIEITATGSPGHVRINKASEALDDIIGPMVNHKVIVMAVKRGQKYVYRDIELDE